MLLMGIVLKPEGPTLNSKALIASFLAIEDIEFWIVDQ